MATALLNSASVHKL